MTNKYLEDEVMKKSPYIFQYIMFAFSILTVMLMGILSLIKPTVQKMHDHVVMPVTFKDGLLNYVGTVTDYYNSLLKVKSTNTPVTYVIVGVGLLITVAIMYWYKRANEGYIEKELNKETDAIEFNKVTIKKLNDIFKYYCYLMVILFIGLSLASPLVIKLNKPSLSKEIGLECQDNPISKEAIEKKLDITVDTNGEKYLKVSKEDIQKGLNLNEYDYTVEDLKGSAKFKVINVLNELYYKVYEDDVYFGFSNVKQ